MKLYPPKASFSEEHISSPIGCCTLKFLRALENDKSCWRTPTGDEGLPYNFFSNRGQKLA